MTMQLQEFRKAYPQYDHLNDEEVAKALHRRYYVGKIPYDEFATKFGVAPKNITPDSPPALDADPSGFDQATDRPPANRAGELRRPDAGRPADVSPQVDYFTDPTAAGVQQQAPGPDPVREIFHRTVTQPTVNIGAGAAGALNRGLATFSANLDKLADFVSATTGLPKGGAFNAAKQFYLQNAKYWDAKVKNAGLTEEIAAEFLGGAAPGMAEFMLNVPYAAALGYAEGGAKGAVKEGAHRALMGKILHAANSLKVAPRTGLMAGVGATEAASAGGDAKDIAKSAGVMAGFGLTAGGRGRRVKDLYTRQGREQGYAPELDRTYGDWRRQFDRMENLNAEALQSMELHERALARVANEKKIAESIKNRTETWAPGSRVRASDIAVDMEVEAQRLANAATQTGGPRVSPVRGRRDAAPAEQRMAGPAQLPPPEARKQQPEAPTQKQPWQMTQAEYNRWYAEQYAKEYGKPYDPQGMEMLTANKMHEGEIRQAVESGKPVPPEVLKDYPDLQPKAPAEVNITPKADETTVTVPMAKEKAEDLSLKEQQAYLLKEIDTAIKAAKADKLDQDNLVKFEVPGDGTFEIQPDSVSLTEFRRIVEKRFPKTEASLTTVPEPKRFSESPTKPKTTAPSTKPTGKRISGLEGQYYNPWQTRKGDVQYFSSGPRPVGSRKVYGYYKDGWYSEGSYLIKIGKGKLKKPVETEAVPDFKQAIDALTKGVLKPAEIVGEFYRGEAEYKTTAGGHKVPTGKVEDQGPYAHAVAGKRDIQLNADYIDHVLTEYPNAKPFLSQDGKALVFYEGKGGEPVAIVMGMGKPGDAVKSKWDRFKREGLAKVRPDLAQKPKKSKSRKVASEEVEALELEAMEVEEWGTAVVPRPTVAVPARKEAKVSETLGGDRRKIIAAINKRLNVPVRTGKFFRGGSAIGLYFPKKKVIRTAQANDIEVLAHEFGHHIQNLLGLGGKMPDEIKAMSYTAHPRKVNREGFAEFLRFYVTGERNVHREAPEFVKRFEDALKTNRDVQDIVVKMRQHWETWKTTPSVQKVGSFVVTGRGRRKAVTFNEIYKGMVDELDPLRRLTAFAEEKQGRKLRPAEDPFTLAWLNRGWARKAEQFAKFGRFKLSKDGVEFTGKSLREILAPVEKKGEMHLLDTYLIAKRALSDPRVIRGFDRILSRADFQQTVMELEPKFERVAKDLYDYNNDLLKYLHAAGRLSTEAYHDIRQNNRHYAPLYRLMDFDRGPQGFSRKKFGEVQNPIKRLKGSSRDILSPTESILYNTYAMINAAERNRVGEAILNLEGKGNLGKLVERVPFPIKPDKLRKSDFLNLVKKWGKPEVVEQIRTSERVLEQSLKTLAEEGKTPSGKMVKVVLEALKSRGWTEAEANQILRRIQEADTPTAQNDIIEKTVEKTTIHIIKEELGFGDMPDQVIAGWRTNYKAGPNEVIFYKRGKPVLVELDPELHQSIMALDADSIGMFTKVLSYPAKWLRAGATLSPEFMARNPARDQWTAFVYSKYGYKPGYDLIRGVAHILGKTETYQKYNASGAAHAALVSLDRKYLQKGLKEVLAGKNIKSKAVQVVKNPLELAQALSELTEEATRVGEFARALKKEGGDIDAILTAGKAARDVTLDFSRIGLKTRSINAITAFWNAQIQGVDKMVRAFKDNPMRSFTRSFLGITVPSILLWYAQHDDPYYQEIPEWRRVFFWNIVTHNPDGTLKHIWSIPKPFELGLIFGSLPEMALDWWKHDDPEGFKGAARSLVESLTPSMMPTAAVPIVEWFANRSIFFDGPIVPRSKEGLDPELQYRETTTETAKLVGKAMAKVPGLEKFASPAKIENLVRGYTGGLGKLALEEADDVLRAFQVVDTKVEPRMTLADVPGIRGFVQRFPTSYTRSVEAFYKRLEDRQRKWESIKERRGLRGMGFRNEDLALAMPKEAQFYAELYQDRIAANMLQMLGKQADRIYDDKSITPDDKRRELDQIYLRMINVARAALGKERIDEKE